MTNPEIIIWLRDQLAKAELAVKAREHAEAVWRSGTDQTWQAAGCRLSKAKRLQEADTQGRIAEKCRRDVQMLKAIITMVEMMSLPRVARTKRLTIPERCR
jgi:hypothetical protein